MKWCLALVLALGSALASAASLERTPAGMRAECAMYLPAALQALATREQAGEPSQPTRSGAIREQDALNKRLAALEKESAVLLEKMRATVALAERNLARTEQAGPPRNQLEASKLEEQRARVNELRQALHEIEAEHAAYVCKPEIIFVGTRIADRIVDDHVRRLRSSMSSACLPDASSKDAQSRQGKRAVGVTSLIDAQGHLLRSDVFSPSGDAAADADVLRLIAHAAPYAPFSPALRKKADVLSISTRWHILFNSSDGKPCLDEPQP